VSMMPVRWDLQKHGYAEVACPTFRYEFRTIDNLGKIASEKIGQISAAHGGVKVDVVTHSMGGLVLRSALHHRPPLRRVVMLSPPNQGAQAAAIARQALPVHKLGWDPLAPLLPGSPTKLPHPTDHPIEVGVLTGGKGHDGGYSALLEGDNDGRVRVVEAVLPGAADFAVVEAGHTLVMARPDVLLRIRRFLDCGRFALPPPPES
jgi:triacylglycerol lipase